jgi:hypothetical protein
MPKFLLEQPGVKLKGVARIPYWHSLDTKEPEGDEMINPNSPTILMTTVALRVQGSAELDPHSGRTHILRMALVVAGRPFLKILHCLAF